MLRSATQTTQVTETDSYLDYGPLVGLNPEEWFLVSFNNDLDIDFAQYDRRAVDYLAHRVVRNPTDLSTHVMRIQLLIRVKDRHGLYGALLDLFIALNQKGYRLRKRMLMLAHPCLRTKHFELLFHYLKSSQDVDVCITSVESSVLSKGYIGDRHFISTSCRQEKDTFAAQNVMQQVNDCIEYGQVDEARILLESAIVKEPWQQELHNNLLEIYWATRDLNGCQIMYERLSDKHIPDPYIWGHTVKRIRNAISANNTVDIGNVKGTEQ